MSNGWVGSRFGFQKVAETIRSKNSTAADTANLRRQGVVAFRMAAAKANPRMPRENVTSTVTHNAASVMRRNVTGSSESRRATTAAAKIQKLASKFGLCVPAWTRAYHGEGSSSP